MNEIAMSTDYIIKAPPAEYVLSVSNGTQEPVVQIMYDGRIFWHGREVETDETFRGAMRELMERAAYGTSITKKENHNA